MKSKLFIFFLAISLSAVSQMPNGSFENWTSSVGTFSYPPLIYDTFNYATPVNWTTSNSLTLSHALSQVSLADSTFNAYSGNKALLLHTDSVSVPLVGSTYIVPGFAANGNFSISVMDLVMTGGVVNPSLLRGAGTPLTTRKKAIGFYLKYQPSSPGPDSCLIWAFLKNSGNIIAEAQFYNAQTISSYTYFEKDFKYYSCDSPDSIIVFISSSDVTGRVTNSNIGSTLTIDSIELTDLPPGFNFAPLANEDIAHTTKNVPITIDILANDADCENDPFTVNIVTPPSHGTASLDSINRVLYTPNHNFVGLDSFYYSLNDGHSTVMALVAISVYSQPLGIEAVENDDFLVYPNPASNNLFIRNQVPGKELIVQLIDVNGEIAKAEQFYSAPDKIEISTEGLASGLYLVRLNVDGRLFTKKVAIAK